MPKAVRYDQYGGTDVLRVAEVDRPAPGRGQVLVKVKAAGINPGEAKIRAGALAERWPSTFPSGQGSDLAGVVAESGEGAGRGRGALRRGRPGGGGAARVPPGAGRGPARGSGGNRRGCRGCRGR